MSLPEECYEGEHDWGEPENVEGDVWRITCKRCGEEVEEVLIVEYWKRKTMRIKGKTYKALKAWGNISLCSECGKVIFDVPLIVWDEKDKSKAVTFHFECAEKLGMIK